MNFHLLEKELKKRLDFPYVWGRKQTDNFDNNTNFIYKTSNFEALLTHIDATFKSDINYVAIKNYALNRWFNFGRQKQLKLVFVSIIMLLLIKMQKINTQTFIFLIFLLTIKQVFFLRGLINLCHMQ